MGGEQRRIRVCVVTYYLPPVHSGAAQAAVRLATALRSRCESFFLTARHEGLPAEDELGGLRVWRLDGRPGRWFGLTFSWRLAWRLWSWRDRYDVVHVHGYPSFFLWWPVAAVRAAGKPCVQTMTMAGADDPAGLLRGRLGWLRRVTYRWVTVKVAKSAAMRAAGIAAGVKRLELIPNGVDRQRFRPATSAERLEIRQALGVDPAARIVLFVGAIHARKGVHDLLAVWRELAARFPDGQLWLAGSTVYTAGGRHEAEPPYVVEARRVAAEAGRVQFWGDRADVEVLMRAADVLCLPSYREGLPNVLLEAHASGLPCVAYRASGVTDIIEEGLTGFSVPVGDREGLRARLEEILTDGELRRRMGVRCREVVLERFTLEAVASKYLELYESLCPR